MQRVKIKLPTGKDILSVLVTLAMLAFIFWALQND